MITFDVRRSAAGMALAVLVSFTTLVGEAHAAGVACGQVITQSTTLDADVGPCPGHGVIIGADNITLDLGGHTVFGATAATSDSSGIHVGVRNRVVIRNGTVRGFGNGVALLYGGSAHTVERLVVLDNRCDGILLVGSYFSTVRSNEVRGNGCDGVPVVGSVSNTIEGNLIAGNGHHGVHFRQGGLSSRANNSNMLRSNVISGNGADGVALGTFAGNNSVVGNSIADNAQSGVHVYVFSHDQCCSLIQGNQLARNGTYGVVIDENRPFGQPAHLGIRVIGNRASGNGLFDLADFNVNCDENTWSGNTFGTRNQPCIA